MPQEFHPVYQALSGVKAFPTPTHQGSYTIITMLTRAEVFVKYFIGGVGRVVSELLEIQSIRVIGLKKVLPYW